MTDVQKQIAYWINGAIDDLESAEILIERKRMLHGLFFCHLVIEKMLKAHVVKISKEIAPRTHNLIYLLDKAHLELSESEEIFLGILMKYQLQGRYPDYNPIIPDKLIVQNYLKQTENLLQWLKKKL
ncbi:MAG: DNA-binding protein [bacterium]|nr:MAG: DNA-binding protein [bacterium]